MSYNYQHYTWSAAVVTVPTLELKINDSSIDQVSTFNFLGLHINSQLTWQTHMDEISKKISRVIGLIYKLQYILTQKYFYHYTTH